MWTKRKRLLIVLVLAVSFNAYGYGVHLFLDREDVTPSRIGEDVVRWSVSGPDLAEGEYFIRIGSDENSTWSTFGTVNYDNLGPITFDGTNSVPYFYEDPFDRD